jgi:hypothetical protein
MPRFTDADHDYFAARIHRVFDQSDRAREIVAQPLAQPLELDNFDVKDPPGFFQIIHLP